MFTGKSIGSHELMIFLCLKHLLHITKLKYCINRLVFKDFITPQN